MCVHVHVCVCVLVHVCLLVLVVVLPPVCPMLPSLPRLSGYGSINIGLPPASPSSEEVGGVSATCSDCA